ncbi:MAG TPA: hypothetical protein VMZ53_03700 [Kofleriaceae bacterium]|nr:hypothetical protein [Kofleriaceae bacterium]
MGDDLARKLYEAWNVGGQHDLAWGLLETEKREQWDAVAVVARKHMREQIALQLEAEVRDLDEDGGAYLRDGVRHAAVIVRPF